ncbi:LytTR family DNA-binding domain-containing protein [Enterococcus devriesei]|uniref:LytTR family DNA-binding domain-containing protein n=1 Tax=Enterococcus devriesei TaxID=319970 RepID=UPI0036D39D8D
MKINYLWDSGYKADEIGIQANPVNKKFIHGAEKFLVQVPQLEIINPKNERRKKLSYSQIQSIEAMNHLSKLYTTSHELYYVRGRLKELEYLSEYGIIRINNSIMLNLKEVKGFKNGTYSRLEVLTKDGQIHLVSRHYAKRIKEELI